jgi:hypothetical protein
MFYDFYLGERLTMATDIHIRPIPGDMFDTHALPFVCRSSTVATPQTSIRDR